LARFVLKFAFIDYSPEASSSRAFAGAVTVFCIGAPSSLVLPHYKERLTVRLYFVYPPNDIL